MAIFGEFPLISSYLVTAAELVFIPLFIFVGGLKFIGPNARALSTLGGLIGTCTMLIIIFVFHFGVKGEGILDVKYQLSLLAMSLYFFLSSCNLRHTYLLFVFLWGYSSAERAPALHAGGQEFESP